MKKARVLWLGCALAAGVQMAAAQAAEPLLMPENKLPPVKSARVFGQRIVYNDLGAGPVAVGGRLAGITIPMLVMWGENDELIPLDQAREFAVGIAGAKLVIVPECGHAASVEKPKEFLAAALPFLD